MEKHWRKSGGKKYPFHAEDHTGFFSAPDICISINFNHFKVFLRSYEFVLMFSNHENQSSNRACVVYNDRLFVIGGQEGDFMPKPGSPIFKCSRRHEVLSPVH